jgi:hypothetical protein
MMYKANKTNGRIIIEAVNRDPAEIVVYGQHTKNYPSVVLYGLAGEDRAYRVMHYEIIPIEGYIMNTIAYQADRMLDKYPAVRHIYVVDNTYGIRRDYREARRKNSMESWIIFKDALERGYKLL